jgi:hypothetical protein
VFKALAVIKVLLIIIRLWLRRTSCKGMILIILTANQAKLVSLVSELQKHSFAVEHTSLNINPYFNLNQ